MELNITAIKTKAKFSTSSSRLNTIQLPLSSGVKLDPQSEVR